MSDTMDPATAGPQPATVAAIRTEAGDVDPARAAHVTCLLENIQRGKERWKADHQRMRDDMDFAAGLQYPGQTEWDDDRYRLNLVLRHVALRVAALYAKNPKAVYRRKPKLDFAVWDERPESLAAALQQLQAAIAPPAPGMGHNGGPPLEGEAPAPAPLDPATAFAMLPLATQRLLADYEEGMLARQQAERLGRTLEVLWTWFIGEPVPNIRVQMKQAVRRAITCGVAWMKLGFQRAMAPRPDQATKIADLTAQLAVIERLRARVLGDDDSTQAYDAEAESLRQALAALQEQPEVVLREGPVLDFPRATAIIPDPNTRSLRGWIGTRWIAEEFELPASQVEAIYHIRVPASTDAARAQAARSLLDDKGADYTVRFWQYYDLDTRRLYTVADGWKDYLEEPRAPDVDLEGFFTHYPIVFNEIEHEKRVFPPSDVELLRSPQGEYNRTRQSLREHRIANRPLYVSPTGAFDKKDKANLTAYDAHDVVTLNSLKEGQPASDLLQPLQKVAIDPNVYEVESLFADTQRATGSQEANLGGTSGVTATETSVAESTRMSGLASNADDLDEALTDLARDFGQVCLMNMGADSVRRIVGRGAVWPTLTKAEIVAEGALEVEAGSSGRPNRERDLANFERAAPYLMQIPGIDPEPLARHALKLLDDRIDLTDFLKSGLPSITAMNAMARPATGDPATEPTQQGGQGASNAPSARVRPGGSQPAYGPSGNVVG